MIDVVKARSFGYNYLALEYQFGVPRRLVNYKKTNRSLARRAAALKRLSVPDSDSAGLAQPRAGRLPVCWRD